MWIDIPFGEWLPDLPPRNNPGALEALNVCPKALSYSPFRSLVPYSSAVGESVLNAFWAQDDTNTVFNFVGGANALYNLAANGTWTDVTRLSGGAYAATDWEFVKFGQRVLATNLSDVVQYFDMGVSGNFAALPGSPPQAARCTVIRDFVFLGDLQGNPSDIHWSGFFNTDIWSTTPEQTAQTQSDSQEIFGRGGRVQKLVGGEDGFVFLEHSIVRLTYEGPPRYFILEEVHTQRGTPAPNSVVRSGDDIFFYAHDGFWRMSARSGQLQPIGQNRVDNWFAENADPSTVANVRGTIDRRNRLVLWAFSSTGAATFDQILIYNWGADRWAHAQIETQCIADLASVGYNLDTIDTLLTNGIDIDSFPVDSPAFTGGVLNLVGFDTSQRAGTFGGAPLVAEIDTKEIHDGALAERPMARRILTRGLRPIVHHSGATVTCRVGHRNSLGSSPTFDPAVSLNSVDIADLLRDARYQRYRVRIDGEFDHAQNCEADVRLTGKV